MKLRCSAVILLYLLTIKVCYSKRRFPNQRLDGCPTGCLCNNIDCLKETKHIIYCREVEVTCRNASITSQLHLLPENTTRLFITGEYMGFKSLDIFARFVRLSKLALPDNVIRAIRLSGPIGVIDYLNLNDNRICSFPMRNLTFLSSLKILKAQYNNLTGVDIVRFPPKLEQLDLSNNFIQTPRKGSFRRLKRLEKLNLQNNSITRIVPRAYMHLVSLESLKLDNNMITKLAAHSFRLLPSLSYLSVTNNLINEIHPTAFTLMGSRWPGLHEIRLQNNKLAILEIESIEILIRRREYYGIYLEGNPIFCDCELTDIRNIAGKLLRDTDQTLCQTPKKLENVSLRDLKTIECSDY